MKKTTINGPIYDARALGTPRMLVLGLQHMFAMFGATVLVPALTGLKQLLPGSGETALWFSAAVFAGMRLIGMLNALLPHEHEISGHHGGMMNIGAAWLFVIAVSIHKMPEGLAIGVAYGGENLSNPESLTIGIALQNIPEGLTVAIALIAAGYSRLKAALAASAVSAMALTGCGGAASSTASSAAVSSSAAASGSTAAAGETFKVGIVNYVDHASLNQIVESVESRLDAIGKEKGVTFDYADYYANAQADQSNLNQIGADLVADGVDVIVAVATPTAATMLAAVEDTDIPVVYSAVTDPAAAGFDGEENITGTSDALNTDAIMNLIVAANPGIDTIGLLYDLSQDSSTQAIADAKAFCEKNGIKVVEKNGTTTAEVQMAAEALVAAGVKAVFTPTDNTIMTAELSIYESFIEAGVQHYTGADSFALNGALVGYGVDYVQLGEATADMVSQLLCDGKTPADLPYQTFDNGIVTINTETAEALGLDLAALKEAFKPYCTEICEVTTAENFS